MGGEQLGKRQRKDGQVGTGLREQQRGRRREQHSDVVLRDSTDEGETSSESSETEETEGEAGTVAIPFHFAPYGNFTVFYTPPRGLFNKAA